MVDVTAVAHPHPAEYTVHDLLSMPDDGQRYEVEDGALVMSPAPEPIHQWCGDRLRTLLEAAAPADHWVLTATAVRMEDDWNGRIPDVLVVNRHPRDTRRAYRADEVLAAIEIVSPRSRSHDRVQKPAHYASVGIPAYWRVELDPAPGHAGPLPLVVVSALRDDRYVEVARLVGGTVGTAPVPYPVTFDPAALLD